MSVELQFRATVLGDMILRGMQSRLRTTCFPSFPVGSDTVYIDHLDVAVTSVNVVVSGNAVLMDVPVDVFIVTGSALAAAPNGTPAGASAPAGQVVLQLRLNTAVRNVKEAGAEVQHQFIDLTCPSIVPQGPLAAAPVDWNAFRDQLGPLGSLDLNPMLEAVGARWRIPMPGTIELSEGVVAVRFGAHGGAANHLFPGQEWGLFLDAVEVERLASERIASELPASLPFTPGISWAPIGTTPHVDIDVSGEVSAGVASADVDVRLDCDFRLGVGPSLRVEAHWSIEVDLGWAVPAIFDKLVREYLEGEIEDAFDPASLGAEPLGSHGFAFVTPLPVLMFGGNRLEYASLPASAPGMTLGGPVRLENPSFSALTVKTAQFGKPTRLQVCSVLAKTGSGAPKKGFTIQDATVYATINLAGAGQFCAFQPVGSDAWLLPLVVGPAQGTPGDTHVFSIRLPAFMAVNLTQPTRVIVRTPRGVRLVELGAPPTIEVDADGQIINGHDYYIKNCLEIPAGPNDFHKLTWGREETIDTNPDPRWGQLITRLGVDLQLVTLTNLEPGELIRFRSPLHAIDVTADAAGRAIVPVMLPIDLAAQTPASLVRVNRRAIAGHVLVDAMILESQAVLPAGRRSVLSAVGTRGAVLTTELENRTERFALSGLGLPLLLGARSHETGEAAAARRAPAADAQTCQPAHEQTPLAAFGLSLPDVIAVMGIPGFPDAPVAVGMVTAGPNLLLDVGRDGRPRVAGTIEGPIGSVQFAGRSAAAEHEGRVAIYGVTRSAVRWKA